ncbi:AAA family ATPase [Solibacillus sp. FSL K6-4121]|uniref:AAA family ATPase n=1 Tax=Solibacillus sp. FSL K6-4121 TaxID=2921505 RepID=UPI0030F7E5E4
MIIWLNGAFGAGKTQTAYELKHRIPNSIIYDPEQIGFYINKNMPKHLTTGDFQDHEIWREFNFKMIKYISNQFNGTIIIPMTITNPQYYEEIIERLKMEGVEVHHFVLCATKETLKQRLKSRFEKKNSWPEQQIDRCMEGFKHPIFDGLIDTNSLALEQVAELIAKKLNIRLLNERRSSFKKRVDRFVMRIMKT